jgi:hypothetical protein
LRRDTILYLAELHNSLKLGKYLPGARIPIIENTALARDQPDYIFLFAWHYADEIRQRLRSEGIRSKLIRPLPHFEVMED